MEEHEKDKYEVHGVVTGEKGPLRGARVVVSWQHIRRRKKLAEGKTSKEGRYRIRYEVPEEAAQPILLSWKPALRRLRHH